MKPDSSSEHASASGPRGTPPHVPDHELLRRIGAGSYGDVWLARNVMGTYRAVKMVYRHTFDHARPFDREFTGIQKFEPVSRLHDGLVDILQVGRNDQAGYFYYVMELADPVGLERTRAPSGSESDNHQRRNMRYNPTSKETISNRAEMRYYFRNRQIR